MDLIFTEDEKDIFRKLQSFKNSIVKRSINPQKIEKLFIKYIVLNRFASLNIDPTLGQFDAFIDEIEAHIEKSTEVFATFLREDNDNKWSAFIYAFK